MMRKTFFLLGLSCLLFSCKTTKKTVQTETRFQSHEVSKLDSVSHIEATIKHYDDTLKSLSYVPESGAPETVETESEGLKVTALILPRYDSTTGKISGHDVKITAIAKPVSVANISKTVTAKKADSANTVTDKKQSVTEKVKPWTLLPGWVWWVLGAVVIIVLIKYGKQLLKYFIV